MPGETQDIKLEVCGQSLGLAVTDNRRYTLVFTAVCHKHHNHFLPCSTVP